MEKDNTLILKIIDQGQSYEQMTQDIKTKVNEANEAVNKVNSIINRNKDKIFILENNHSEPFSENYIAQDRFGQNIEIKPFETTNKNDYIFVPSSHYKNGLAIHKDLANEIENAIKAFAYPSKEKIYDTARQVGMAIGAQKQFNKFPENKDEINRITRAMAHGFINKFPENKDEINRIMSSVARRFKSPFELMSLDASHNLTKEKHTEMPSEEEFKKRAWELKEEKSIKLTAALNEISKEYGYSCFNAIKPKLLKK